MSINAETKELFKKAAMSIFDSMVSRTDEYYLTPVDHDPVTGVPQGGAQYDVRMYGATVSETEGLDEEVRIGDRIFYIVFDELSVQPVEKGAIFFEGVSYQIFRVEVDGAEAAWKCFARIP